MSWVLTLILCAVLVEVALRLPFSRLIGKVRHVSRQAPRVITSRRISEHWKERAVGTYAGLMFGASLALAVLIALLLGIAGLIATGFEQLAPGYMAFLLGWQGILASLILATGYFLLRKRLFNG